MKNKNFLDSTLRKLIPKKPFSCALILSALTVFLGPNQANAGMLLGFHGITKNNTTDTKIGETQFFVEITDGGINSNSRTEVAFRFYNTGPGASSITDIYFDDGALLGSTMSISNSTGVSFSQNAKPGELSGGKSIGFQTSSDFSADSDSPVSKNGVNPGEELTVVFELQSGVSYDDLIASLYEWQGWGKDNNLGLNIGIHVQAFKSGGSESFVTDSDPGTDHDLRIMPVPPSMALMGMGAFCVLGGFVIRRVRLKSSA